jgi:hypothetical protein
MQHLSVKVEVKKEGVITQHDKHMLCLALIKAVMSYPTQTIEAPHVQELPQQGQNQESVRVTQEQRCLSYA